MLLGNVILSPSLLAAEKMMAYTQQRQRMLAENIANIDNPHYRAKQLDTKAFQAALGRAIEAARRDGPEAFRIPEGDQFRQDAQGRLVVEPGETPPENVLFHDDTNARIERQMAMMAENTMMHEFSSEILRHEYEQLLQAVRGRVA